MTQRDSARVVRHPNYAWKTRNLETSLRKLDHFARSKAQPVCAGRADYLPTTRALFEKLHAKFCLPPARSSFSSIEVFRDCSGGNSRPSRLSGVGGGTFLMRKNECRRNVH